MKCHAKSVLSVDTLFLYRNISLENNSNYRIDSSVLLISPYKAVYYHKRQSYNMKKEKFVLSVDFCPVRRPMVV